MKPNQAIFFGAVLFLCAGCDHVTKRIAHSALAESPPVSMAADTIRFELVTNSGAFLSFGARLSPELRGVILLVLVPFALAILCVWVLRSASVRWYQILAMALVAGGGFANWLDRVLHHGAVTDFVSLGLGPLRTGVFNVADVAITLGLAAFLFRPNATPEGKRKDH